MLHKARYNTDNGSVLPFGQTHFPLQHFFVIRLVFKRFCRIIFINKSVGFGIIYVVINSVYNACKLKGKLI